MIAVSLVHRKPYIGMYLSLKPLSLPEYGSFVTLGYRKYTFSYKSSICRFNLLYFCKLS